MQSCEPVPALYSLPLYNVFACLCRLLATLIIQPTSSFGTDVAICKSFPNSSIAELSKQHPGLISHLAKEAKKIFEEQLHRHFKHERWDGKNINPCAPIFGPTDEFLKLRKLHNIASQHELNLHMITNLTNIFFKIIFSTENN